MIQQPVQKAGTGKTERQRLQFLRVGLRYGMNLIAMVAKQQGYLAAATVGSRFVIAESVKLPTAIRLALQGRNHAAPGRKRPGSYSPETLEALSTLDVEMKPYYINTGAFHSHVRMYDYPKNYAAGPVNEGGVREKKLLEYFVSLDLLAVQPTDVVIDVASEWSIFPEVLHEISGAKVYRQDLIYAPGIKGDRIGGSAARMPVPDRFADKLVLHNAFEHFEGTADTDFIIEAWRVLRPGGILCILPLYLAKEYYVLTDPLINRRGIVWDEGAQIVESLWWHNRFGRFYDVRSLEERVLLPASRVGFKSTIYHTNVREVAPYSDLHFALIMRKPKQPQE